jgi:membrane-associated phospholipid phosphatase
VFAAVVFLSVSWSSRQAAADDDSESLRWSPRFTRFTTAQYALTLVAAGGMLATDSVLHESGKARWNSAVFMDGAARNFLAASSESGRRTASRVSDYLALGVGLYPFVVDALLVAGQVHGNYDAALQMSLIGAQSLLITNFVTGLTKRVVRRARPDAGTCVSGDEMSCSSETESFLSGHTAGAFAGAGLICAAHQNLNLYGDGPGGAVACGMSLGVATAVGTLRMVADRHHLTDVLAGAALGLATGWLLPNLINYDFGASLGQDTLVPVASNHQLGFQYISRF